MKRSKENPTQLINCMKHITFIKIDCMAVFYLVAGLSALWVAWLPGKLPRWLAGWMELHWTPLASPMRQLGGCSGAAQFRSSPHLPSSSCALPFVPLAGSLSPPPLAGRLTPAFNATGWKPELDAWTLLPLAGSLSWTPGPLLSWALLLKVMPAAGYKPHRPLSRAIPASPRYPPET